MIAKIVVFHDDKDSHVHLKNLGYKAGDCYFMNDSDVIQLTKHLNICIIRNHNSDKLHDMIIGVTTYNNFETFGMKR